MSNTRIVVDNSCDIPPAMAKELDITLVPLVVNFGKETYLDTELTRDEFWKNAEEICHPKTSQPPVGAFIEAYQPLVEAGHEVICLTITGKHSGTYNSAWAAAQEFEGRVTVVDSLSLSWGLGWQALAAREAAESGRSVPEIVDILDEMRERSHVVILLDTIEYLERGGRASRLMPIIKRAVGFFKVKPLLTVVEGELKLLSVARSYRRGLERLSAEITGLRPLEKLAVIHIRRPQLAEQLADELSERLAYLRDEVVLVETGTVLSCQGGPGVTAAFCVAAG